MWHESYFAWSLYKFRRNPGCCRVNRFGLRRSETEVWVAMLFSGFYAQFGHFLQRSLSVSCSTNSPYERLLWQRAERQDWPGDVLEKPRLLHASLDPRSRPFRALFDLQTVLVNDFCGSILDVCKHNFSFILIGYIHRLYRSLH